ncbi:plasmid mobilization relaxosome protein MobC [Ralstonia pseudosolanacearum]|uniref:plasmid mobilization protein n=1 Tax=Ralstonia pseudosolanacearum TaxID=1310165 RepID=UPI000B0BBF56|nr:plasmid mobilization relaxosome protein MobC [Ralstonia pseudosolanacearum]AXV99179.1 plasmid mobilization relaxosome protein MobC [Ralstonia solanacearum]AZU59735.1 plasmid mobilization relaxosome protein MobC [Ralstonia solanacearum]NKF92472.1 CopG family [Ralstonia solanacearum]NKG07681.1 CopG family [Ralstonia solanacearum]RAA04975.1 plasmid mobilization relaxosome protein MobC [Ralstonia pseudosolanacearum]
MPKSKADGGLGKPISFRLPDVDREAYLQKVRESGLSQSEFFRQAVLGNRTQLVARLKATPYRKRLLFIYGKVSDDLTRLARQASVNHARGALSEDSYLQLLDQLQLIGRYLKATLAKVD